MKIKKLDIILGIWISLINSLVLSFAIPLIAHSPITVQSYFAGLLLPFILGIVLVTLIPLPKWGNAIAGKLGTKPQTLQRQLVAAIFLVIIMGTIMTLCMSWWNLHTIPDYTNIFFFAWLKIYPWALLVIYVSSNIAMWTGIRLAKKILHIPEAASQKANKTP